MTGLGSEGRPKPNTTQDRYEDASISKTCLRPVLSYSACEVADRMRTKRTKFVLKHSSDEFVLWTLKRDWYVNRRLLR